MLYYSDSNDLKKNKNILNNQNYVINTRIKSNLIFESWNGNDNYVLKFLVWKIFYFFRNIKSDFSKLILLHIFILIFCLSIFFIVLNFDIILYLTLYSFLSTCIVSYYYYFKQTKVFVMWFRKNLGNIYEDKLIRYRDYGDDSNRKKYILFISFVYSWIVNLIFYSIYLFIKFYA